MIKKYHGYIFENYADVYYAVDEKSSLYVRSHQGYWAVSDGFSFLFSHAENMAGDYFLGKYWYVDLDGEPDKLFQMNKEDASSYDVPKEGLGRLIGCVGNRLIGAGDAGGVEYIFSLDLNDQAVFRTKASYSELKIRDNKIFSIDWDGDLACFDLDLKEIWRVSNEGTGSLAVYPIGFDEESAIFLPDTFVVAHEQSTGKKKWQYELEMVPHCISVSNGKVYLALKNTLLVLDSKTGGVIVNAPDIYPDFDQRKDTMMVYPVDDNTIIVYASSSSKIKFLSTDGRECYQELDLSPSGYATFTHQNYPFVKDGKIYIPVNNARTSWVGGGGLLVLKPIEENEPAIIERQERYPYKLFAEPAIAQDHQYSLYMGEGGLEHICRYAGIIVKELIYETGYIPRLEGDHGGSRDYLHDGGIEIFIDPTNYTEDEREHIDLLMKNLQHYLEMTRPITSVQDYDIRIKIKLTLLERSKWSMNGDMVDLDGIIEHGKPLNEKLIN